MNYPENKSSNYSLFSSDIVYEVLGNEAVVLNLKKGLYYSFNQSASVIWELILNNSSLDQIKEATVAELGENHQFLNDIDELIKKLLQEELISPCKNTQNAISDIDNLRSKIKNNLVDCPKFIKHSDLEDLLLLDPIHDVNAEGWPNRK